jgi:diacylglycerol kinase (ATP)
VAHPTLGRVDVDLVINRKARRLGDGAVRDALLEAAREHGVRVHETWSLAELDEAARTIGSKGTDTVVLAGGDGSVMEGLSALSRELGDSMVRVAVAPAGTVNTIARNLGIRGVGAGAARRALVAACSVDSAVEHATLRVTDGGGGARVGFIFGAGLVARFFDAYYGAGNPGLVAAAGMAARVLAGSLVGAPKARAMLAGEPCTVRVDGVAHAHRAWSLVLASVVRDVGLHIHATYRAGEAADRFHLVASGASPRRLGFDAPRVLLGRALRAEPRIDELARSLEVAFDGPGAYVLDGDLLHATQVRVEPGPRVRFVVA